MINKSKPAKFIQFAQWTLLVVATLLVSSAALAFGSVRMRSTHLPEIDGRWKFSMKIDYGSKPHMGHIPFDFVFVQKVYYEYAITDANPKPTLHRKPMHNQKPSRESMDIGFADARGEPWRRTKFSFSLRRDRGYEAGEYELKIKRTSDGRLLGRPMRIVLEGKNEVIDRRAIVFAGEKKADKKKRKEAAEKKKEAEETSAAATDTEAREATEDDQPEAQVVEDPEGPPAVNKRPGGHGCGCRIEASGAAPGEQSGGWAALLLLAGLALVRRRA